LVIEGKFIAKPARISKCRVSFLAKKTGHFKALSALRGKLVALKSCIIGTKAAYETDSNTWCWRTADIQ
jgi:hypothetical protein